MGFKTADHDPQATPRAEPPRRAVALWPTVMLAAVTPCVSTLEGATIVCPSDQYPSFYHAMQAVQPGDTVRLLPGTYGTAGAALKDGVALVGSGPSVTALRYSDDRHSTLKADNVRGALLEGLTLVALRGETSQDQLGYWSAAGGALYCRASEVTIRNCVLAGGNTRLFTDDGIGGAIYATEGSSLTLVDCVLRDNCADAGGAIYFDGYASADTLTMVGCVLESNRAFDYGGAVYISGPGRVLLERCRIVGNTAGWGAAINSFGATLTLRDCVVMNNIARGSPGAVVGQGGPACSGRARLHSGELRHRQQPPRRCCPQRLRGGGGALPRRRLSDPDELHHSGQQDSRDQR